MGDFARNRRLASELAALSKSKDTNIILFSNENLNSWTGFIRGPAETPFAEGWFKLHLKVADYPFKPPKVNFVTKVFHPNVSFDRGEICLEILKPEHWNAQWTLESVLRGI